MKIIAYIPVRLNSTRIRNKPLQEVMPGVSLLEKSLQTMREVLGRFSGHLTVVVNTPDQMLMNIAFKQGFRTYSRPVALDQSSTTTEEILADFIKYNPDCETDGYTHIAILNPTNPLITPEVYLDFFESVEKNGYDTAFSTNLLRKHAVITNKDGTFTTLNYSPNGPHPRTQDLEPVHVFNWSICCWSMAVARDKITQRGSPLYHGKVGFIDTIDTVAVDVDTFEDLVSARRHLTLNT